MDENKVYCIPVGKEKPVSVTFSSTDEVEFKNAVHLLIQTHCEEEEEYQEAL